MDDDPIATFMAITLCPLEEDAIMYLSLADFDLGQAITLYEATKGNLPGGGRGPTTTTASGRGDGPLDPLFGPVRIADEEPREAPTPTTADISEASPTHVTVLGGPMFPAVPVDNPELRTGFAAYPGAGQDTLLSRLFSTPPFVRDGERLASVCGVARREDMWVLVAVRDTSFLSSCIARDVWNSEAMSTISSSLVCVEYSLATLVGQQLASSYRIDSWAVPNLFIVDPFTSHRELEVTLRKTDVNGIRGRDAIEQVLSFMARHGSPRQRLSEQETRAERSPSAPVRVDSDSEGINEEEEEEGDEEVVAVEVAAPAPAPAPPATATAAALLEVTLTEWSLPADDKDGFRLRVRLPRSNPTLCLRPATPVARLLEYLAYRVHAEDAAAYLAGAPALELRAGFPPKVIPLPEVDGAPVSEWPGVRSGEAMTVHIKP